MKFRAAIAEESSMSDFANIIFTLSKTFKEIAFTIESDKIIISGCDNTINGIPWAWTEIQKETLFSEYHMEGIDPVEHPFIVMSMNPIKMANALISLRNSPKSFKMKLVNKQFPCLSVNIESSRPEMNKTRQIAHDVPVSIIPSRDWPEFQIPSLPKCYTYLAMPSLRSIKGLVDKLKNLGPSLTIYSKDTGQLSLVVESESVTVASHYKNLDVIVDSTNSPPASNDSGELSCRVDSKKLALSLSAIQFQFAKLFCSIIQDETLKISAEIRDNVLFNYILGAVIL